MLAEVGIAHAVGVGFEVRQRFHGVAGDVAGQRSRVVSATRVSMSPASLRQIRHRGSRCTRVGPAHQRIPPGAAMPHLQKRLACGGKVNDLLATGASTPRSRARNRGGQRRTNRGFGTGSPSTRSGTTAGGTFPCSRLAHAAYRQILERRAQENQVDFVNGVATAITPFGVLRSRDDQRRLRHSGQRDGNRG